MVPSDYVDYAGKAAKKHLTLNKCCDLTTSATKKVFHTPGKTMSISFIWHLVFQNLTPHAPVMNSWKKWTQLLQAINKEISQEQINIRNSWTLAWEPY